MKLPLRLDADLLNIFDANGDQICYRDRGMTYRYNAERARELRRIVAAVNFTQFCTTEGMERIGSLPIGSVAQIELENAPEAETHFSGPVGLVRS